MLRVKIFNPTHRFGIAYFSDIPLGDCQVRMAQNHLADNFDGNGDTGGMIDFYIFDLNQK